jgi:hypothetical protein
MNASTALRDASSSAPPMVRRACNRCLARRHIQVLQQCGFSSENPVLFEKMHIYLIVDSSGAVAAVTKKDATKVEHVEIAESSS